MTLARAHVIKALDHGVPTTRQNAPETARRIPGEVIAAREEAARIIAEAKAEAARAVAGAVEEATRDARDREVARLAASFLALRQREEESLARQQDRLVDLATVLAERLLGDALRLEPARIAELAVTAMQEARGARKVWIDAAPDDAATLGEALSALGQSAEISVDPALGRGSLVVHTDLGRIDARIEPQLARLASALREALR